MYMTYDANNKLVKAETDSTANGTIDYVTNYVYDANGNLVQVKSDYDNDGLIESITYYTWEFK